MFLVNTVTESIFWVRRSSALRLTLLLAALFAVGLAVAVAVSLSLGRDAVVERIDLTLEGLAASVEAEDAPEDSFSVLVRSVSELRDLPRAFRDVARQGGGTVGLDRDFRRSEDWRVLITEDNDGEPLLIAVPLDDSEDALDLLEGILWSTAMAVVLITLAIGLGAGLLAQRRLTRITFTLDRLGAGDLKTRTGIEPTSDDLDDLAQQLDTTASELERLVAQTRHLSASIAHDLRTPLARLRAQLEMLPEGDKRGAALEEAAHLSGIFDTIMRVARIEAQQGTDGFAPVDLGLLIDDLEETFGPVVEDSGKRLFLERATHETVQADKGMLIQAVANLLQNAIVHGGPDITLFVHGRSLGVYDNGDGVDPLHFPDIVKPMVRLDRARTSDGTGLGLALVRAVADRHRAALILSEETPQGLRATLKFAEL